MSDTAARPRGFFGQPPALGFLAFTEGWERFSYYGMTSLLVLYMSKQLFLTGHVENIVGFAGFRAWLESMFGKMSPLELASQFYGLYTAFVYFTPIAGGWIADRFIGRKRAVMAGALLMSLGHFAMAFDASFLLALVLLIAGCGLLKGNISTQVGQLYGADDAEGRARGFAIFSMAINVGAVAGPLACGALADLKGWHAGFGLAGVLMLLGLGTYAYGYPRLNEQARVAQVAKAPLTRAEWRTVAALFAVMALTVFHSVAYFQNGNMGLVWIDDHVDKGPVPSSWFPALDAFVSIVMVPPLIGLWRRFGEPGEIVKIATGAALACAANLSLAVGAAFFARVPVIFPLLYGFFLGVGFLYYWPTLLALVSRAAPAQVKATMMGAAFLSLFVSNFTLGHVGMLYAHMRPETFWLLNAAIAATGSVLALAFNRKLSRVFAEATR